MNKSEMLMAIKAAVKSDIGKEVSKEQIDSVLKAYQAVMMEEIKKQGETNILDLGKIKVGYRAERQGKNLQTGAAITIPAANVPKFSFSKKMKELAKISTLPLSDKKK